LSEIVIAPNTQRDLDVVVFKKSVPDLTENALERFVARARRAVGLHGDVHVLVTGSRDLQALNRRYLGKDRPTDVLSFPPMQGLPVKLGGDVAISADIAARNARQLGHRLADEVKVLALHGVLHLAGYDHERDRGRMARKEAQLRRALCLPPTLTERSNGRRSAKSRTGRSR
jgi:probable rRNA maturation factor